MKKQLRRYFKFWVWIDLVGLASSLILIASYLKYGDNYDEHIQNLWSNLGIEVLGVWLSVRIIDFLIERHKNFKETRFHQLRNLQYFYETALNIYEYNSTYERDIENLQREVKYFDKRWHKRKKHFYRDEKEEIQTLRNSMPQIIETSISVQQMNLEIDKQTEKYPTTEEGKSSIELLRTGKTDLKAVLKNQLSVYIQNLENIKENVWEETHPDD
jgi:hypothetical protein